jgi:hypothetical protein
MFTSNEKEQIREVLEEFKKSVIELFSGEIEPIKDGIRNMEEKIDYLCNAVDRLNRFDWKGVARSTAIGIATNLTVDTEMGRQIFMLFQQAFQSIPKLLHM